MIIFLGVDLYLIYVMSAIICSFEGEEHAILNCFPAILLNLLFMFLLVLILLKGLLHL